MPFFSATFADRTAAGLALAAELGRRSYSNPVLLALPRGGVPVALEAARSLHAPLDLVMVRKIGAPGHREYAIGAVVDGAEPQIVIDRSAAASSGASDTYIENATTQALAEIKHRRARYGAGKPERIAGRTAIVVDDGIATGSTMLAALKAVRRSAPERIVVAVPVAAPSALERISPHCDEIVCLHTPQQFHSVGAHYDRFDQTTDDEVVDLLAEARSLHSDQHG